METEEITASEVLELDDKINLTLKKNNVTERVLNSLKEKYSGLKLVHIEDKESYLEIKEARKEVRKVGILVEKLCKLGREEAISIQKKWLSKEKELLLRISEVQDPLDKEIEAFDAHEKQVEEENRKMKERKFIERQTELLRMSAEYIDGSFVLGNVSYEDTTIRDAEDDIYNEVILPKYKEQYDIVEAEKAEAERKRKEQEEEMKRQQQILEQQRQELEREKERIQKQQDELRQRQEDAEKLEAERKQAIINGRCIQLEQLGLIYSFQQGAYVFGGISISKGGKIDLLDEEGWSELINEITPQVEKIKQQQKQQEEEKRRQEVEEEKQAAIKAEIERIKEEKIQEAIKAEQQKQKELEELAQADDKTKWEVFIEEVKSIKTYTMSSNIYKRKMAIASEKLEEIINL